MIYNILFIYDLGSMITLFDLDQIDLSFNSGVEWSGVE